MSWPNDADGDVFRRLQAHGFDFSESHTVDFNVDFESWPPAREAIELLESMYGLVKLFPPSEELLGFAEFRIHSLLSYELVTSIQRKVSKAMLAHGGICETWGVMQNAA